METFVENADSLEKVLNQLASVSTKDTETPVANFGDEFAIYFVPPNTYHPLIHVAGKSATGFFLASKVCHHEKQNILGELNHSNEENESEEEHILFIPELERVETERVLVGIPISQSVVQLLGSSPLHTQTSEGSQGNSSKGCKTDTYVSHAALYPLNIHRARYLLSLYIHVLRSSNHLDLPPLWALADGASPQNTFYMASLPDAKSGSVRNVAVTCGGPVMEKDNLPSLEAFMSQHRGSQQHQVPVETHGYALYEVLGPSSLVGGSSQEDQSCIFIEFAWDGIDTMLQRPPHSCDSVLHIKTIPGSLKLATQSLFLELQRLVDLNNILTNLEEPWPAQEEGAAAIPVSQNMDNFFEGLNSGNLHSSDNINNDDDKDSALGSPIARFTFRDFRKDFDFTEELWLILKDALSENDLIAALRIALSALLNGSCQAVIHSSNQTAMAKMIRQIMCSETAQQKQKVKQSFEDILQEESAVHFLVEIGVEKLRRDYANYFMGEELVTLNQLSYYLDTTPAVPEMVSRVQKLYSILEMVITSKLVLSMSHENLRVLVEAALGYYKSHAANMHPVFSMSLPAFGSASVAAMKQTCTNSLPSVWCVAITTAAPLSPQQTSIVQMSSSHPIRGKDASIPDASVLNDIIGNREIFSFYLTHAKHSTVKMAKIN